MKHLYQQKECSDFTFKNDDILREIGIFTNFDKNMRFKTFKNASIRL